MVSLQNLNIWSGQFSADDCIKQFFLYYYYTSLSLESHICAVYKSILNFEGAVKSDPLY